MDAIRVSKVEHVTCTKSGVSGVGTVHLTAHHLIFKYDDEQTKEMWIPYPLVSLVNRLPQTLQGQSPLNVHCRTFETISLSFEKDSDASDVFDSVKELTVAPSVSHLYAFFYTPNPPFPSSNGWSIYSARDEFGRMGVGSRTKAWRFTDVNKDYSFCPTYPTKLVIPTRISDTTLQYASKYRSKCRIPVLSYLHWSNFGTITRSSQPMVGVTQNRSIQDEKLIEAIFQSHQNPESRATAGPVYGASTTNLIIDARPTVNAVANTAKGAGTENMEHYKEGKKVYLGIDHIHTMRESLAKVVECLRDADNLLASINNDLSSQVANISVLDRQTLRRSGWLRHITAILEGTVIITRNVHINSSHVLIHCSDGWDRTSQLSALAQLCLDPFYRTIKGFQILIEKDWLSFGHKFLDRCGHLSSEKFFVSPSDTAGTGGEQNAAQTFIASVQNRFVSQQHIKETSPVFHQFLESVRQIQRQFPQRFEFNERFLHQLYYHLYSCQFGSFLLNSERDRRLSEGGNRSLIERTVSAWDFFNAPSEIEQNLNPNYDQSLDDPTNRISDMGVLYPNPKDVRFWHELYGRSDEEMNGRPALARVESQTPDETEDEAIQRSSTPSSIPLPPSPSNATSALPKSNVVTSPTPAYVSAEIPRRPVPTTRSESFRPMSSTSSAFSMKPPSQTSSPSTTASPNRGAKTPDFFSNTGVKSVWGKLSSNASAALSAVQEAYEGVRNTSTSPEGRVEELRGRDALSAWGEGHEDQTPFKHSMSTQSQFAASDSNPWASIRSAPTYPTLAAMEENPWGSVATTRPGRTPLSEGLFSEDTKPLPPDPTVPLVAHVGSNTTSLPKEASPPVASKGPDPQRDTDSLPSPANNIDPLGVGLI